MSMISLGLSGMPAAPTDATGSLILTGLTDGQASPGDTLRALLSDGTPILSYAWGSSPGTDDYGTGALLVVPPAAAGRPLHITLQTQGAAFTGIVQIKPIETAASTILPEPGRIFIETLAPLPPQPDLVLSAGASLIIVENA